MSRKKTTTNSQALPTPGELEILRVLWKQGTCTIRQVVDELSCSRDVAYTTVQTLLTIMVKKGFVQSEKSGKAHDFSTILTRGQAQSSALKNIVNAFFDNSPGTLAQHIIDSDTLDEKELSSLRKLIDDNQEETQ